MLPRCGFNARRHVSSFSICGSTGIVPSWQVQANISRMTTRYCGNLSVMRLAATSDVTCSLLAAKKPWAFMILIWGPPVHFSRHRRKTDPASGWDNDGEMVTNSWCSSCAETMWTDATCDSIGMDEFRIRRLPTAISSTMLSWTDWSIGSNILCKNVQKSILFRASAVKKVDFRSYARVDRGGGGWNFEYSDRSHKPRRHVIYRQLRAVELPYK